MPRVARLASPQLIRIVQRKRRPTSKVDTMMVLRARRGSNVIGVSFAATRDLVSFLRYERADRDGMRSPMIDEGGGAEGTGISHALAFGVSQSGRFLRHFLELGINDD